MITVFERIPDIFVELYDEQFQIWAREFRRRGNHCAVVFKPVPGQPPMIDAEGRRILKGAWLDAVVESSGRIVIRPATPHDEEMIARHVHEMRPHVLQ